jgi:hypothetical protein
LGSRAPPPGPSPIQCIEQEKSVGPDLQGECFPFLLAFGQAIILDATGIALKPGRLGRFAQPVGHHSRQVIQRGSKRLGHQFNQVQVMHCNQYVGAVGPLLTPSLDQAVSLEVVKHPVQEQVLRPARYQARPELRQHAEVEARIGKLEPEGILPVDPRSHGISGLAIAEVLQELKDRHQRQTPRG